MNRRGTIPQRGWNIVQGLGLLIGGMALLATVAVFGIDSSVSSYVLARDGVVGITAVTIGVALLWRRKRRSTTN